jgi:uncharacterized protein (TIGR00369 family)
MTGPVEGAGAGDHGSKPGGDRGDDESAAAAAPGGGAVLPPLVLDIPALHALMAEVFPPAAAFAVVTALAPGQLTLALKDPDDPRHLRPGGTISGPVLFTLADLGFWLLVLGHIGPVPLAVTTNLNLNFLRKARPGPLRAVVRLLKLGKRLAVGDVTIDDDVGSIAHAQVTYAIPSGTQR